MMKILIIKISSMGDIIHTLPSLTDARKAIPNICFDWVIEEDFIQIPTWHEAVDQVIPVAIRRWCKSWFSSKIRIERKVFKNKLHTNKYDAIIDAQGLLKSAMLITNLIYGTVKHGLSWKSAREPIASLFYNCKHYISKEQHAVERNRELFAKSLNYKKSEVQGTYNISKNFLEKVNHTNYPYIIFLYATTTKNKRWPELYWRKLVELMQFSKISIKLFWNNEYEYQIAKKIAIGFSHIEILPKISLTQIAKIIMGSKAVISVDTGLSHLTAALDKTNITLFGPTNPNFIGGYGKNQYSIISSTKKMKDITVNKVFNLIQEKI